MRMSLVLMQAYKASMFKVYWELMDLNQIRDAVVATFFDIYEDVSSGAVLCVWNLIAFLPCLTFTSPVFNQTIDEIMKANELIKEKLFLMLNDRKNKLIDTTG